MKLNVIYEDLGRVVFDEIEVEEKPKTYKMVSGVCPKSYVSIIYKASINRVVQSGDLLVYDCSKEEAIKIWNDYKTEQIKRLEDRLEDLKKLVIE